MATTQFTQGILRIINGSVDLLTDDIKAMLVDTAAWTVNLDTDDFVADIPSGDRIASSANLGSKTVTIDTSTDPDEVVFDAADTSFSAVTGDPTEAVVIYKDTGDAATSPLLFYMDGSSVQLTPNGNDVNLVFNASGIARWKRG